MKCYYHKESDAVGVCKSCNKGICNECAKDMGGGLACIDSCEETVMEMLEQFERGNKIYGIGKHKTKMPASGVLMWGLFAIFFWGMAVYIYISKGNVDVFTIGMAGLFSVAFGLAYYSTRRTGIKC
jgi:hypothetical protein